VPVTGEQLRTLMDVRRPDTGDELRRVGASGEAVAALDATFSAPKSVSAVWALGSPELRERIEAVHEIAINRALTYAVQHVPMLRQRIDASTVLHAKAVGLVATSWRHTTARAVADQVPDPQLHSHVLLHTAHRRNGRLVAIDSRTWLQHQREVGAAYRTELARELARLGFAVERGTGRGERYFELAGVPHALLDRWSSRHHQVQAAIRDRLTAAERDLRAVIAEGGPTANDARERLELLLANGQLAPAEERLMGTITRTDKIPVSAADLDAEWRRTARAIGFMPERVEVLRRQQRQPLTPAASDRVLDALTEFDATFPARDARAVALERSAGTRIDDALRPLAELRNAGEILRLADGSGTTREHRAREQITISTAQRVIGHRITPLDRDAVVAQADRLDRELQGQGGRLSDEQRDAIMLACSDRQLVMIEGQAGTGKSTALTGIARADREAGRDVIVTSTAGVAAERLARELHHAGVHAGTTRSPRSRQRSTTAGSSSDRRRRSSTTKPHSRPPANNRPCSPPSRPRARD
jgi:conjugative relaxase-like TrwC/TraI family protein